MKSRSRVIAATISFISVMGCAHQSVILSPAKALSPDEPLEVIDVHTHPEFYGDLEPTSHIPRSKEEYARELKEANVVGTVLLGDAEGKEDHYMEGMDAIRCAGVGRIVDVPRISKGLKSGFFDCIKIYLGYTHQFASDKNYEPAYRLAEQYQVPVVYHTGDTYTSRGKLKYSDPLTIDEVAVDHPKVNFVIAHCGNPWFGSAAEVAYKNPNVFIECSALMIGDLSKKPPGALKAYVIDPIAWIFGYIEDPSKMMFGTDWPLVNIKSYLDVYKQAIPREHWKAVFHDNAVRVFKFKPKPAP